MVHRLCTILPALLLCAGASADVRVNADSRIVADFEGRLASYMKVRKQAAPNAKLRPTASPEQLARHEREFAAALRAARPHASQGDLFTPQIAQEFRRLIGLAMQGSAAQRIHQSLKHAEPVTLTLHVNRTYPPSIPLQSTPPSLLLNLPALPKALEYRLAGRQLALRDVEANLIVDFIPGALP